MGWQVSADLRLFVEVAFGKNPITDRTTGTWTDITGRVRSLNSARGRASVLQTFDPGRLAVVVDNRDGAFDPGNTSSVYAPDVVLGLPVRFRVTNGDGSTSYTVFVGFVDAFDLAYGGGGFDATVTLTAIEDFSLLGGLDLAGNYPAQATGARVDDVLDEFGWPTGTGNRDIDGGLTLLRATNFVESSGGVSVLQHLQDVATAEQGEVFQTGAGAFRFYQRTGTLPAVSATFGQDASTDITYTAIVPAYDRDQLINQAVGQAGEDDLQIAEDATSIAAYGAARAEVGGGYFANSNQALNAAEFAVLRRKDVTRRIREVTVKPLAQSSAALVLQAAGGLELRDQVTVEYDPPGSGTAINQGSFIESIVHNVSPNDWTVTYGVSPRSAAEADTYWVLGTATLGTDTVLA